MAASYFQEQLNSPSGQHARRVLEQREITSETIKRLGLGYAPPQREALTRQLLAAGHQPDLILASGLAIQREGDKLIDRFRNRLMIPICRTTGSVIAFGGRSLESGQQPKYINSPETELYTKGRTLYGLHLTKDAIRRLGYSVMVEGYFDFAQALQAGVAPLVATCGTTVTDRQTRLLKRFTSKVILSFDSDTAGHNASTRSGELLVSEGLQVNVTVLDNGEDPDTTLRRRGQAHYIKKLKESTPYLEFVLDRAARRHDFSSDEQRRAFLTEMLSIAAKIPDAASRDQFADKLAHKARVLEDVVRTEIRRAAVARRTRLTVETPGSVARVTPAERGIIWAIMHNTSEAQQVITELDPEDLDGLATSPILQVAKTLRDWPVSSVKQALLDRVTDEQAELTNRIASAHEAPARIADCAIALKRLRLERERNTLQSEIDQRPLKATTQRSEDEIVNDLLQRKHDLLQRIAALEE